MRNIPGFRSGSPWKAVVATAIYAFAALCSLMGVWSVGLVTVVAAVLVANPGGIRAYVPLLNSVERQVVLTGIGLLTVAGVIVIWAQTPPASSAADDSPARATARATFEAALLATPTPPPTATPLPSPTPVPPTPIPPSPTPLSATDLVKLAATKRLGGTLETAKVSPINVSAFARALAGTPVPDAAYQAPGDQVTGYATVDYDLGVVTDEASAVRTAAEHLKGLGPNVFFKGVDTFELRAFATLPDASSAPRKAMVLKFTLSYPTAAEIKWDAVDLRTFGDVLTGAGDGIYVHPAIAAAWRDFTSNR